MKTNPSLTPNHNDICIFLSTSRSDKDPRTAPAASLVVGHHAGPQQLQEMFWTDIKLPSYALLIRDPKGGQARSVQLTPFLVRQLIPLVQQDVRPSRPFGKPSPAAPTITQLLNSVLVRAGLSKYTLEDFVTWSLAQTEAVRASVVTA
jgi:hypothetical protein